MASQPGQDWSGGELASRLDVKPPNLLTQLAEWTRLGFLSKPAAAGMPCLVRPDRRALPPAAPDRNPEIAATLLTLRQHALTTRHYTSPPPRHARLRSRWRSRYVLQSRFSAAWPQYRSA